MRGSIAYGRSERAIFAQALRSSEVAFSQTVKVVDLVRLSRRYA
jgi:hypothetical protein